MQQTLGLAHALVDFRRELNLMHAYSGRSGLWGLKGDTRDANEHSWKLLFVRRKVGQPSAPSFLSDVARLVPFFKISRHFLCADLDHVFPDLYLRIAFCELLVPNA